MGAQWKIVEKTPTVFLEGQCHIYDCCSINGKQLEDLSQTDKQKNLLCSAPVGALNTQLALKFPVQIPSIKYQKLEELQFSLIELGIVEAKLVFILYAPKGLIRRPFKK